MPLSAEEMRLALARGLGRALLHARAYGVERDRELVLAACLRNQTYDPQCEGSRADWMVEFLDGELAGEFLSRMVRQERFWDADQQARLAFLLARRGQVGAREALYRAFEPHPRTADLVAGQEILELDGPVGFRELLRRLRETAGERLGQLVGTLKDHYEELYGPGSADPIVGEELIDWRADEARAVQSLDNLFLRGKPCEPKLPDFEEIWRAIEQGSSVGFGLGWLGKRVPTDVAEAVFERLASLREASQLARAIQFFSNRGLPRVTDLALRLVDHPSRWVRHWSIQALSRHKNSEVRSLALRCLRRKRWRSGELRMLNLNYQKGDEKLVLPILRGDAHRLIFDLSHLCEANPGSELLEVMMFVYEFSPCLNCREAVIKVMRELEIFPDWAAEEHRYDALTFSSWN